MDADGRRGSARARRRSACGDEREAEGEEAPRLRAVFREWWWWQQTGGGSALFAKKNWHVGPNRAEDQREAMPASPRARLPPPLLLLVLLLGLYACPAQAALSPNRPSKPLMGWSTWESFRKTANHSKVMENVDILQSAGLQAAGYTMIQIDDGWQLLNGMWAVRERSTSPPSHKITIKKGLVWPAPPVDPGCLQSDPAKYPLGMAGLGSLLHGRGFKFGMYTAGTDAACSDLPHFVSVYQSGRYAVTDAACFAAMQVDLVKVDNCNWQFDAYRNNPSYRMTQWRNLLPSNVMLYNSHFGCTAGDCSQWVQCAWQVSPAVNSKIPSWCANDCDLARVSWDARATWMSILRAANALVGRGTVSRPGFWSDPDYLVPRDDVLSLGQRRSQFALWCVLSAPLIISTDLRTLSPATIDMFRNADAIRVDQTYAGNAGDRFYLNALQGVWGFRKPLGGGEFAVVVVNVGVTPGVPLFLAKHPQNVALTYRLVLSDYRNTSSASSGDISSCLVKNVWTGVETPVTSLNSSLSIPPQDSVFILVRGCA
jgi:alpha-galactosidase